MDLEKQIDLLEKRVRELEIMNMSKAERIELGLNFCPKCGSKAIYVEDNSGSLSTPDIRIECSGCRMETQTLRSWQEDTIIEIWNEIENV